MLESQIITNIVVVIKKKVTNITLIGRRLFLYFLYKLIMQGKAIVAAADPPLIEPKNDTILSYDSNKKV